MGCWLCGWLRGRFCMYILSTMVAAASAAASLTHSRTKSRKIGANFVLNISLFSKKSRCAHTAHVRWAIVQQRTYKTERKIVKSQQQKQNYVDSRIDGMHLTVWKYSAQNDENNWFYSIEMWLSNLHFHRSILIDFIVCSFSATFSSSHSLPFNPLFIYLHICVLSATTKADVVVVVVLTGIFQLSPSSSLCVYQFCKYSSTFTHAPHSHRTRTHRAPFEHAVCLPVQQPLTINCFFLYSIYMYVSFRFASRAAFPFPSLLS